MGVKLTINKMKSEELAVEEKRKGEDEINKLKGKEKLEFEISVLKGRLINVREDIKHFGGSTVLLQKIKIMEEQIKLKEEELKKECVQ